jgi:PmbA protein
MDYTKLTRELVEKALKSGADDAEVYLETSRNLSIQVQDGEIETIEESSSAGIGFRVLVSGKLGFSHCNDLSTKALEDTIQRAVGFAKLTTADENNVLPGKSDPGVVEGLYDPAIISVPMEKKIQMAKDLEKSAMSRPGITKSSGAGYGEGEGEVYISNSNGLSGNYRSSGCSMGVSVVAEKGDQKNTGGEYCSRRFFSDLLSIDEIAAEASRKALELIDPIMISTQRASVIFDADAAFSLLGGIIAAINGERVLQGASFLKNSLNQPFASALLTLVDDGLKAKGLGSAPFDAEGVATIKRILVEKGVLKGFLYNTITAKRAGVASTGNASRGGFNNLPGIGTHNVYVEAGTHSPEEIIRATQRGLLVKEVTGYGINPVNGNFSGGASGLWIENGEVKHPVKGVTIAGSALEIFTAIDMLGNNLDFNRPMAAPTFRVAEMQIGGK